RSWKRRATAGNDELTLCERAASCVCGRQLLLRPLPFQTQCRRDAARSTLPLLPDPRPPRAASERYGVEIPCAAPSDRSWSRQAGQLVEVHCAECSAAISLPRVEAERHRRKRFREKDCS